VKLRGIGFVKEVGFKPGKPTYLPTHTPHDEMIMKATKATISPPSLSQDKTFLNVTK